MSDPLNVWSDARAALIRKLRHEGQTVGTILAELNRLDGPAITISQVRGYLERQRILLSPDVARQVHAAAGRAGQRTQALRRDAEDIAQGKPPRSSAVPPPKGSGRYNGSAAQPWRCELPAGRVELPPPGPDGRVEALLGELIVWTRQMEIEGFDGGNVEALNRLLAARKLPPVVVVERR